MQNGRMRTAAITRRRCCWGLRQDHRAEHRFRWPHRRASTPRPPRSTRSSATSPAILRSLRSRCSTQALQPRPPRPWPPAPAPGSPPSPECGADLLGGRHRERHVEWPCEDPGRCLLRHHPGGDLPHPHRRARRADPVGWPGTGRLRQGVRRAAAQCPGGYERDAGQLRRSRSRRPRCTSRPASPRPPRPRLPPSADFPARCPSSAARPARRSRRAATATTAWLATATLGGVLHPWLRQHRPELLRRQRPDLRQRDRRRRLRCVPEQARRRTPSAAAGKLSIRPHSGRRRCG